MRKFLILLSLVFVIFGIASCTGSEEIKLVFEENGGDAVDDITISINSTSITLPEPTRSGYTFDGWFTDEALTAPFSIAVLLTQQSEIKLYAKWTQVIDSFTMTFETNGGSAITAITLAAGATITPPADPTKTGFTFGGWYSDAALTTAYTITTMPNQNITIYAKWNAVIVSSTITFNSNGGSAVASITQNEGTPVTQPANPTKEGHTFGGWYSDVALATTYTFGNMPATNLTLYAKWTPINYTIIFEENGGSAVADIAQAYLSAVTQPVNPTKEGHTFAGWYSDIALTTAYTFSTMPLNGITLYAKWTPINYTIIFEENGGSVVTDITQAYLSAVTQPTNPTKEGHTFAGWYSDIALTTAYTFSTMPLNGITLYAKWTPVNYTIIFEENGGSVVTDITQAYLSAVTQPVNPTKEGHTFAGWYSDIALTTAYTFSTMPLNGITLYAKWTINDYTITFEENGGSAVLDITQTYLTTVTKPADPTKDGYTFDGWYSDVALTTAYTFSTMPGSNLTLYAKWSLIVYTITWNDGSQSPDVDQYNAGATIVLPTNPTKVGYTFDGWFKDLLFLQPFDLTLMPANNIVIYAKWIVNLYTVTYNTHGGDLPIEDESVPYMSSIPNPGTIMKVGMLFDGWYADDAYTIPFDFSSMPASNITIHAKWIVDDGYDRINTILETNPYNVKVRGIIYYKFPGGMNPGFYIYDGTGYMFVLSMTGSFNVGDTVEFEAIYDPFEMTPQLTNVNNMIANGTTFAMPTYTPVEFADVANVEEDQLSIYGKPVIISGYLSKMGMTYYIMDLGGSRPIAINYKSVTPMNDPFMAALGGKVTFQAIVHDYNGYANEWHILYNGISSEVVATPQTDQDKVNALLAFGEEMLDGQVFYVGQTFKVPAFEPVFGATITAVTFGTNSPLYDPETGEFESVLFESVIDVRITVTLNQASGSVEVQIILKPVEIVSIETFKLAEDFTYHQIQGVVMVAHPMFGIAVIADETGMIVVILDQESSVKMIEEIVFQFKPGDLVIFGGYKVSMEGLILMVGGEEGLYVDVISSDQPSPIDAIPITIAQFLELDPMNPLYWIQYFEISGTITFIEDDYTVYLSSGELMIPIMVTDKDMVDQFRQITDFEVIVRGLVLPSFDEDPMLMFVYSGLSDAIEPNYTDQGFIDYIKILFQTYLESLTFYPGQIANLPTRHPIFDLFIAYDVALEDSLLIDLSTMRISNTITEDTWISLTATLTYGDASGIVDIELYVKPIDILTVAEFLAVTDQSLYFVQGVIIFIEDYLDFFIIADETGILMSVSSNYTLNVGDLVLLQGVLMNSEGMMILANDPDHTVQAVLNTGVAHPLVATPITLEAFTLLDATDPLLHLKYYEVEGLLMFDAWGDMFFITDDTNNVPLFVVNEDAYDHLMSFEGTQVKIKGFSMRAGTELFMVLIFLDYPGEVVPRFTDAELAAFLGNQLVEYYEDTVLRPGAFHKLPDSHPPYEFTVAYEVFGANAGLYNLTTGAISALIDIETFIDVRATITVGLAEEVVEFQLHVVPIETQTIAEFKAGVDGDFFTLRGIVVMNTVSDDGPSIIADATGHLFIAPNLNLTVGDEVIITGYRDTFEGLPILWDENTTTLVEVVSQNRPNPMTLVQHTIDSFLALDLEDRNNWGIFVEVTGYLDFIEDSYMPLIREGFGIGDFIPIVPMFMMENHEQVVQMVNPFEQLMMLQGFRFVVKGFLIPSFEEDIYAPDRMIVIAREQGLKLDYVTDQEKMDALVDVATYRLETGRIFRPFDYIELPDEFPPFNAFMEWTYIGSSPLIDLFDMQILDIAVETQFLFEVVITIGALEETHVFTLTAQPYPLITIDQFYELSDGEYGKLQVIVVHQFSYGEVIFQDRTSTYFLYGKGYNTLEVGDEAIILAQHHFWDGYVNASNYASNTSVNVIATEQSVPYVAVDRELTLIANQSLEDVNPMGYYRVKGKLIYNTQDSYHYLTDGLNTIQLITDDYLLEDALALHVDNDVQLSCFNTVFFYTSYGPLWTCFIVDDDIVDVVLTNQEVTDIMRAYMMHQMNLIFKDGLIYQFSTTHPVYGGTYSFVLDPLNALDAQLTGNVIQFTETPSPNPVVLHITASYNGYDLEFAVELEVVAYTDPMSSYNPGSMGALPVVSNTLPHNTFGGFRVVEIDRQDDWFGGTDMIVDLEFPYPTEVGAHYFTLQYFDDIDQAWYNFMHYDEPLVSEWNNFSLAFGGPMRLRLLADNGMVSNEVMFSYTSVETSFAGWYLDMSMYLTGVMNPFVGSGYKLEEVTVYDMDGNEVTGGISLQWYRVNPYTWEETLIPGAIGSLYVTTYADVGYMMMVKVTGDEINVGGMMKIYTDQTINLLNKGYVTNTTNMGFDIGFDYIVNMSDLDELQIYNAYGQPLEIIAILETNNPYVFRIKVDLIGESSMQLHFNNMIWTLGGEAQFQYDMIGLYVYLLE